MKAVSISDIETIERAGHVLFRLAENDQAIKLLALALRLREEALTPVKFFCDIDESGGLAEVVELDEWSKRV